MKSDFKRHIIIILKLVLLSEGFDPLLPQHYTAINVQQLLFVRVISKLDPKVNIALFVAHKK